MSTIVAERVDVEPVGAAVMADYGETIMDAALRAGWRWPTVCHGDGECSVCSVEVIDGAENLGSLEDDERDVLELVPGYGRNDSVVRLACRATVFGPVAVRKRGARPTAYGEVEKRQDEIKDRKEAE